MAYYSESGYCAAEEMNRPAYVGNPGYYGEGGERYAVRKEYEEIDEVERARRGHYGHGHGGEGYAVRKEYEEIDEVERARRGHYGHGHLGHGGGSHHQHAHGGHEHFGGHREHGYGGRPYDACESKYYA